MKLDRVQSSFIRFEGVGAMYQSLGDTGILVLGELHKLQFPLMYESLSWR